MLTLAGASGASVTLLGLSSLASPDLFSLASPCLSSLGRRGVVREVLGSRREPDISFSRKSEPE